MTRKFGLHAAPHRGGSGSHPCPKGETVSAAVEQLWVQRLLASTRSRSGGAVLLPAATLHPPISHGSPGPAGPGVCGNGLGSEADMPLSAQGVLVSGGSSPA